MFKKLNLGFSPVSSNRIMWVDLAKAVSIIGVLIAHLASSYLTEYSYTSGNGVIALFFDSFIRFAIIIFLMVSGFLLLRKEYDLKDFFRKRFTRVLTPFLFWILIYIAVKLIFQNPIHGDHSFMGVLTFIVNSFLNPKIVSVQFWFVYMIFALYIVTPVLGPWLRSAKEKDIEYFLVIWAALFVLNFFKVNFLLTEYLTFFTGFVGYFVLGYYLVIKKSRYLNSFKFGLKLFLIGGLGTFLGTLVVSHIIGQMSFMFIQLGDLTPFAVIQAVGVFIMVKNFPDKIFNDYPLLKKAVVTLSLASYGVYLINVLVLRFFTMLGIYSTASNPLIMIPLFTVLFLVLSTIIVLVMNRIPILKKFSGMV